ncbi:hypothetical protein, partial [Actinosynnema sp.]|uniref:hypothetical protein n=1 Tax=Actinosynnema sp. TaxID=1872144 RepID=UPI003F8578C7
MAEQPVDGQDESDGSTTAAQAKLAEAGWPRRGEGADRDEATTRISKAALGGAEEKTAVLPKPVGLARSLRGRAADNSARGPARNQRVPRRGRAGCAISAAPAT